uniref:Uncharacterized protein n=1 Tax=Meloidogyne floridensis TaxID=298350 RepID=A0A915NDN7_9BILA
MAVLVQSYQHYLLVICAYSPDSLGGPSLCDVIESHLTFLLIKKFETLKFIKYFHINPKALFKRENCPKATGIKEENWKCTGWVIGFKILKEDDFKENIEELKKKIKSLKENDFKKYIDKNGEDGKIKIGASYLNKKNSTANPKELERITELMTGLAVAELKQRNSKELAMSAIVHGNRLLDCINQGMNTVNKTEEKVDETERNLPSVPCYRLTAIAAPLMNHLKALLQVIQDQSTEIQRLKETEQNTSRKTASEETLVKSDGCGGQSPVSSRSVVAPRSTPHLTALRATPSNCSSSSSPTSVPFE